ncbi:glycoside hydrolase family 16 protein [Ascidiimonas aurantiaca]|uniref:glycoside hydrolase family 16 protein n=1 Tax=Ascidiimonas aurantiaca TaxID=1685432 RepID=UPI0030EBA158
MKKSRFYQYFVLLSFVTGAVSSQEYTTLVWEEQFEGKTLDHNSWSFELGDGCPSLCGWGNNERQIYTKVNHKLKNGYLIITAKKEDSIYTSTRIVTKNKKTFQYGRIEIKAKLPAGKGLWPAFWMLGSNIDKVKWPACGEIDVLEYVGKEPHTVFTSLHTTSSHGNTVNSKKTCIPDIEKGFHVYEALWTPERITFLIDRKKVYEYAPENKTPDNWPFNQPFYFIINLAIGGNFGGPYVDNTIFPQNFVVDYIRVYQ